MARRSRTLCSAPLGVPDPLPLRRFGLHMIIPYVLHRSPRRVLLALFALVRFVIVIVVIAYVFLRSPVLSCMLVCLYALFCFVFASSVVHIYYSSQCPFCRYASVPRFPSSNSMFDPSPLVVYCTNPTHPNLSHSHIYPPRCSLPPFLLIMAPRTHAYSRPAAPQWLFPLPHQLYSTVLQCYSVTVQSIN